MLGNVGVGERAAAAGLVEHVDVIQPLGFPPDLLHQARGPVVAAARRGQHHEFDRLLRLPRGLRGTRRRRGNAESREEPTYRVRHLHAITTGNSQWPSPQPGPSPPRGSPVDTGGGGAMVLQALSRRLTAFSRCVLSPARCVQMMPSRTSLSAIASTYAARRDVDVEVQARHALDDVGRVVHDEHRVGDVHVVVHLPRRRASRTSAAPR